MVQAVWTSVLYVRVSRLCCVVRACHRLKSYIDRGLLHSERVLLTLAVVSPFVYAIVHFATIDDVPLSWFAWSAQFAAECVLALLILLPIAPLLVALSNKKWECSVKLPQGSSDQLIIEPAIQRCVRGLRKLWAGCALACLVGPTINAFDVYQVLTRTSVAPAVWDTIFLVQCYLLIYVLAPVQRASATIHAVLDEPASKHDSLGPGSLFPSERPSFYASQRTSIQMSSGRSSLTHGNKAHPQPHVIEHKLGVIHSGGLPDMVQGGGEPVSRGALTTYEGGVTGTLAGDI